MARQLVHSISTTAALVGCSRSTGVSIYQERSKEETVADQRQVKGGRGSLMNVGAKADLCGPIHQMCYCSLNYQKQFTLCILTESCQNTQRIAVCCVWGRREAVQYGYLLDVYLLLLDAFTGPLESKLRVGGTEAL